ncbi:hypothetical protein MTBLM5_420001 [Magnetospirillum sp. LM-5]|nr:hypothetical protein MTBLM5_420001 [Magnetospirillum sp. LM-5]
MHPTITLRDGIAYRFCIPVLHTGRKLKCEEMSHSTAFEVPGFPSLPGRQFSSCPENHGFGAG